MGRVFTVVITLMLAASVYVALFGLWAGSQVVDADAFNASALESFDLPGSEEAIGEIVADKVVEEYPVLRFARSSLASLLGSVLATEPLEPALVSIAEDVHERLFGGSQTAVIIDLGDYEEVLIERLDVAAPGLISLLPGDVFRQYTFFDAGEITDLRASADRMRLGTVFAIVSVVASILLLAVVVRPAWVAVAAAGVALVLAALVTYVGGPLTTRILQLTVTDDAYRVLAVNLFAESSESLMAWATVVGVIGVVLVAGGIGGQLLRRRSLHPG